MKLLSDILFSSTLLAKTRGVSGKRSALQITVAHCTPTAQPELPVPTKQNGDSVIRKGDNRKGGCYGLTLVGDPTVVFVFVRIPDQCRAVFVIASRFPPRHFGA